MCALAVNRERAHSRGYRNLLRMRISATLPMAREDLGAKKTRPERSGVELREDGGKSSGNVNGT